MDRHMYICICNSLKENDLKKACMNKCMNDGESVLRGAGCKAECGQCLDYIESLFLKVPDSHNAGNTHLSVGA